MYKNFVKPVLDRLLALIFVLLFYGYMVFKLFKKKGKFMSLLVPILIVSVLLLLVLDLLKLIDFI